MRLRSSRLSFIHLYHHKRKLCCAFFSPRYFSVCRVSYLFSSWQKDDHASLREWREGKEAEEMSVEKCEMLSAKGRGKGPPLCWTWIWRKDEGRYKSDFILSDWLKTQSFKCPDKPFFLPPFPPSNSSSFPTALLRNSSIHFKLQLFSPRPISYLRRIKTAIFVAYYYFIILWVYIFPLSGYPLHIIPYPLTHICILGHYCIIARRARSPYATLIWPNPPGMQKQTQFGHNSISPMQKLICKRERERAITVMMQCRNAYVIVTVRHSIAAWITYNLLKILKIW